MKATRKGVSARARASGGAIVALALAVPLSSNAEPGPAQKDKPTEATEAPGASKVASPPRPTTPPGTATGKPGAQAPGAPARGATSTTKNALGTPAAQGAPSGAAPGPARPSVQRSPEAEARQAELIKKRRERTINDYHQVFEQLNPPPDGKELGTNDRKMAKRKYDSAKRRIVALHRGDTMRYKSLDKEKRKQIEAKVQEHREKLKADREQRAEKERAQIKAKLGEKVSKKPVRSELKRHAWRIARLEYLMDLAEARENEQLVAQAKMLIAKENERHEKMVAKMRTMTFPDEKSDEGKKDEKKPAEKSASANGNAPQVEPGKQGASK